MMASRMKAMRSVDKPNLKRPMFSRILEVVAKASPGMTRVPRT
jgi:hypothetical protein